MNTVKDAAPHGRGMAWATLLVSAGISLGVNLWHAFDLAPNHEVTWWFAALATLYGTAPVVLAAFQSHSAAFVPMGRAKRGLTYLLVLLGMVLSVQAQAAAVEIFAGPYLKWVFPILVDLSAFMALHTLMTSAGAEETGAPEQTGTDEGGEQTGTRPRGWLVHQTVSPAEPLERSVPAAEVPAEPVQAESVPAARTEPVPAVRTGSASVPDRSVPAEQTGPIPAADRSAEHGTDRTVPAAPDRSALRPDRSVPALASTKSGDAAALERLDRAFAGVDPAEVSIGMVRKALDGAGFARGKRLHGLWVARTGADRTADRSAGRPVDRSEEAPGADRSGEQTGTGSDGPDHQDGTDRADRAEEPDRTADRATVPA